MNNIESNIKNLFDLYTRISYISSMDLIKHSRLHEVHSTTSDWPNYLFVPSFTLNPPLTNKTTQSLYGNKTYKLIYPGECSFLKDRLMFSLHGMSMNKSEIIDQINNNISIRKVKNIDSMMIWSSINNIFPNEILSELYSINEFSFYVGYYENIPVASCMTFFSDNILGIYSLYVKKSYRNKGIGSFVTLKALLSETNYRDAKNIILQSAEMGFHLYSRIGFKKTHDYNIYNIQNYDYKSDK